MRRILRIAALMVLLGVVVFWAVRGRSGWTHNSEEHTVTDPVTGIDGPVWEKKFTPGWDFLGGGFAVAGVLAAGSFAFRRN